MIVTDSRTPLEQWWDGLVRQRRHQMSRATVPDPQYISVQIRKGTAHPLDPSECWMNWSRTRFRSEITY